MLVMLVMLVGLVGVVDVGGVGDVGGVVDVCGVLLCLPPLITQVKQRWAWLVLGWETVKNGPQERLSFLFS